MSANRRTSKTRTGCLQCKQRKIKCDESKPSCIHCLGRKAPCSYLQYIPLGSRPHQHTRRGSPLHKTSTTPRDTPPHHFTPTKNLSIHPNHFTLLDLRLLHFYTTTTTSSLLSPALTGTLIWRTTIVFLSFAHPFLLSSLLALSALHLSMISTNSTNKHIATSYYTDAISSFRREIQVLDKQNAAACCAAASLLSLYAWAFAGESLFFGSPDVVPWHKLHRGAREVIRSALKVESHIRDQDAVWEVFSSWMAFGPRFAPTICLEAEEDRVLGALPGCWRGMGLSSEDEATLEETVGILRGLFGVVSATSEDGGFEGMMTLSWAAIMPVRFCGLIEEGCGPALVLVAFHCVLLKRYEGFWWINGKAESVLREVRRKVPGGEWDAWLEWPVKEIERLDMVRRGEHGAVLPMDGAIHFLRPYPT